MLAWNLLLSKALFLKHKSKNMLLLEQRDAKMQSQPVLLAQVANALSWLPGESLGSFQQHRYFEPPVVEGLAHAHAHTDFSWVMELLLTPFLKKLKLQRL